MSAGADILLLSLGTTRGLRIADGQLAQMLSGAGATVTTAGVRIGATDRLRRGYPVNDIVEAIASRRALRVALARHEPRAVIVSSTTAALLLPALDVPFAVWLDSPARLNRPGRRNEILHILERRSLARARRVLVLSPGAAAALPAGAAPSVVIAPPLPPAPPGRSDRELLVVAYTPDPKAKDLELACRAWTASAPTAARLVITGVPAPRAISYLARRGLAVPERCELAGMLEPDAFARLLDRARVFLSTARWEDFGQTPLQALDRGALMVAAPAGGPFPALAIARELAPGFVSASRDPDSVAAALRTALAAGDSELAVYQRTARERLEVYRAEIQIARLAEQVLPALLQ